MPALKNHKIVLASRPVGEPKPEDFRFVDEGIAEPGPGEVLLKTLWLSLDPYMRGRMSAAKSYAEPVEIGASFGSILRSPVPSDFAYACQPV